MYLNDIHISLWMNTWSTSNVVFFLWSSFYRFHLVWGTLLGCNMQELFLLKYVQKTFFINEITGHCVTINLSDDLSIVKHAQIFVVSHCYHNIAILNCCKPSYCGFRMTVKGKNLQQMLINVSLGMTWWANIFTIDSLRPLYPILILTSCHLNVITAMHFSIFVFLFFPLSMPSPWFIVKGFLFYSGTLLKTTWDSKYNDSIDHHEEEYMIQTRSQWSVRVPMGSSLAYSNSSIVDVYYPYITILGIQHHPNLF